MYANKASETKNHSEYWVRANISSVICYLQTAVTGIGVSGDHFRNSKVLYAVRSQQPQPSQLSGSNQIRGFGPLV